MAVASSETQAYLSSSPVETRHCNRIDDSLSWVSYILCSYPLKLEDKGHLSLCLYPTSSSKLNSISKNYTTLISHKFIIHERC